MEKIAVSANQMKKGLIIPKTYKKVHTIYLYLPMIFLSLLQIIIHNTYFSVGCFLMLCITCWRSIDFDVSHPYVWFVPMFTLYSISYPLLNEWGYLFYDTKIGVHSLHPQTLMYEWLAICVFIVVVSNTQVRYHPRQLIQKNKASRLLLLLSFLGLIILRLRMISVALISGITSKTELIHFAQHNLTLSLGNRAGNFIGLVFMCIVLHSKFSKNAKITCTLLLLATQLVMIAAIGDRGGVIELLVQMVFAYNFLIHRIRLKAALILGGIILFFTLFASSFKSIMLYGIAFDSTRIMRTIGAEGVREFISKILQSEFSSASLNLSIVLTHRDAIKWGFGSAYLAPFLLVLTIVPRYLGLTAWSYTDSMSWYNDQLMSSTTYGMGYSIVADGFVELGVWGVIITMSLLAFVMKYLYQKSKTNIYYLISYFTAAPLLLYTCRSTLYFFSKTFLFYNVFPLILLVFLSKNFGKHHE